MFAALGQTAVEVADFADAGVGYTATVIAQGPTPNTGPRGEEFGKASPIGLFVILALLLVVIVIGFGMNRRLRRFERRRAFAEDHGIDVFDAEGLEKAMKESGYEDYARDGSMYARTEVPQTDDRFMPASRIEAPLTGPAAIEAERQRAQEKAQETAQDDGAAEDRSEAADEGEEGKGQA